MDLSDSFCDAKLWSGMFRKIRKDEGDPMEEGDGEGQLVRNRREGRRIQEQVRTKNWRV